MSHSNATRSPRVAFERDTPLTECCPVAVEVDDNRAMPDPSPVVITAPARSASASLVTASAFSVEPVERFATLPELDAVLGGGTPRARVIVLAGDRGSGKTRLATQALATNGGVFVSAEEQLRDVAQRCHEVLTPDTVDRVQLHHVRPDVGLDEFAAIVDELRPPTAALDSFQAIAGEMPGPQRDAAFAAHELSRRSGTTIFLLSQMNAEGRIRGSKALEQWCDAILRVTVPTPDELTPDDAAHLDVAAGEALCIVRVDGKNRHGSPHAIVKLKHTARGLRPLKG